MSASESGDSLQRPGVPTARVIGGEVCKVFRARTGLWITQFGT